jgi:curved DNA-binding protein CbpA
MKETITSYPLQWLLGIASTRDLKAINEAWRVRAQVCHPDRPGKSHVAMSELNKARDQAVKGANA